MTKKIKLKTHKQYGFTLVEVMVAMVIFSVGLLGLAGLQSLGMTNNQTAFNRTIAMQQAYNMSDRIRNNIAGVNATSYDALDTSTPALATNCIMAACLPAALAAFDHFEWNTNNDVLLPEGKGSVTLIARTPLATQLRICVMWNELKVAGAADPDCANPAGYDPTSEYKFYTLIVDI